MTASATQGGHNKKTIHSIYPKVVVVCPLPWGGAGSPSNTMLRGQDLPQYHATSYPSSRLAKTDMGRGLYGRRQSLHP